jgi:hypothetical protein
MALRSLRILALVLALTASAAAQFQGYFSPQTTQQTLATAALCTGAAQTYPIQNLGQTQHWLSVAFNNAITFHGEIDGIDRQGNVFRISDVLETQSAKGVVIGTGYYPQIQVVITCAPVSASYTASYSGAWGTPFNNVGHALFAQIDKTNMSANPATTSVSDSFATPFGNSSASIYIGLVGTVTGGTVTATCNPSGALAGVTSVQLLSVAVTNTLATPYFPLPDYPCPSMTVAYTAGSGSGNVTLETIFNPPGGQPPSQDPCSNNSATLTGLVHGKSTNQIANAPTGTTAIINVPGSAVALYVCGVMFSQATTAGTVQFEFGTGTACATDTVILTGAIPVTAATPISFGNGGASIWQNSNIVNGPGNGTQLCIVVTGTGAVSGFVTYVSAQ